MVAGPWAKTSSSSDASIGDGALRLGSAVAAAGAASAGGTDAATGLPSLLVVSTTWPSLDAAATLEVAPAERRGAYAVNEVRFRGHVVQWLGEVDAYSDVDELLRLATTCGCC